MERGNSKCIFTVTLLWRSFTSPTNSMDVLTVWFVRGPSCALFFKYDIPSKTMPFNNLSVVISEQTKRPLIILL